MIHIGHCCARREGAIAGFLARAWLLQDRPVSWFRWIAFSERDSSALHGSSRSENAIHLGGGADRMPEAFSI